MIELFFVACLGGEPAVCRDRALHFADVSLMTCVMGAQPVLAQWADDHPRWEIRHWGCRPAGPGRTT